MFSLLLLQGLWTRVAGLVPVAPPVSRTRGLDAKRADPSHRIAALRAASDPPEWTSLPTPDSEVPEVPEDEDDDSRADGGWSTLANVWAPPSRHGVKLKGAPGLSVPEREPLVALDVDVEPIPVGHEMATATRTKPSMLVDRELIFEEELDLAYDVAIERLVAGERDDERGVRVMGGFAEVDPASFRHHRHVDWVLEEDRRWAIYLTKMDLGAHEEMGFRIRDQMTFWEQTVAVRRLGLPRVVVGSNITPRIEILGKPTKARVDAGIRLRTATRGSFWRAVFEIEVKHLNFVNGTKRIYDYMRGWPWLRVGVVFNLWDHRDDGTWVGIACVWRRDKTDRPMLDRVFDMGTCNHDRYQNNATEEFLKWLRPVVEANNATLSPSIDLDNFDIERAPPGLPKTLPEPPPDIPVPPTPELRRHFTIPIYAADLLYGYDSLAHLIPDTPTFEANVYDLLLNLNCYESNWNEES